MDLTQLKRSRAARKTAIARTIQKLDQDIVDKNIVEVENGLVLLQSKEMAIIPILKELETKSDAADLEQEIEENETCTDSIIMAKMKANRFLSSTATIPVTTAATFAPVAGSRLNLKLPKLQISKFDGTLNDWERFWDQFSSGIDANGQLNKVDKFNYLRGFLSGEASRTIQGLKLTEANYQIAKDLLTDKYGSKDILVETHINSLLKTMPVKMSRSGQELRRFYEEFCINKRALEALGTDVTSLGAILCPIILKSIPSSLLSEWNRKSYSKGNTDINLLLDFVKEELVNIEQVFRVISEKSEFSKEGKNPQARKTEFSQDEFKLCSSSTLVSTQENKQVFKKGQPYCVFCENNAHRTSSCLETTSNKSRRDALRNNGRCFNCLRKSHISTHCEFTIKCRSCHKNHHTLLCPDRESKLYRKPRESTKALVAAQVTQPDEVVDSLVAAASCHASTSNHNVHNMSVLQSLRLWINNAGCMKQVVVLVDGGSERSFITERAVRRSGLNILQGEKLTVHSFGGNSSDKLTYRVPFTLEGNNGRQLQLEALQVDEICNGVTLWESGRIENFLQSRRTQSWSHLMGDGESVAVDILIGADLYWRVMTAHMKRLTSYLMATESIFGWLLLGSTVSYNQTSTMVSMLSICESSTVQKLDQQLTALWELDKSGILAQEEKSVLSVQDVEVLQNYESTTTFTEGRYQVEIPWNEDKEKLCLNFFMAKERLKRLLLSLQKDPEKLERYRNGIYEYLKNGHIEEVPFEMSNENPIYYMPHHPIIKEDRKTTKLRIVFDASSHSDQKMSLNQCQYAGPNLNPLIFDLLLRFRWNKIAISSDVEKAFLQVELKIQERDATRFLWTDEVWTRDKEPALKIFRMTRVLFGMKASPFLLAATIRFHVNNKRGKNSELAQLVDENTYVDDFLGGSMTVEKSFLISKDVYSLFEEGGMLLKKWVTNSPELRVLWQKEGFVSKEEPIELLKVLGLIWNPATDVLSLKYSVIDEAIKESKNTKRGVLETLARVFDPLGFIAPKVVSAKLLLQELWRLKIGWDVPIPEPFSSSWKLWKNDLAILSKININRWYGVLDSANEEIQLHLFCDASPKAYGVVAYLRITSVDTGISVSLITAKSRIAPLEVMSIPRLELMACLIAARLAFSIRNAWRMPRLQTVLWSDSRVALEWIKGSHSNWKLFVGRRVKEIQALTLEDSWSYCPSKSNAADVISRGQSLEKLCNNQIWWNGPEWLTQDHSTWPKLSPEKDEESISAVKKEKMKSLIVQVATACQAILKTDKFSTWSSLVRITAWIMRFLNNARRKKITKHEFLTASELRDASLYWFQIIQKECFPEEHRALLEKSILNPKSRILKFNPFLDNDGLIRMGGRLKFASIGEERKHPVLLSDHKLVTLYIIQQHLHILHGGVQSTLIRLRWSVWILRGRQTVRKALRSCLVCRKWEARPAKMVEAPLPAARICQTQPFMVTGLDFAGPLWIKEGTEKRKSYICLFTCAVTRAIHLELVSSQGIKPFLLAFRRFISRRGLCKIIYSDNAKVYHQTDNLLREAWSNLHFTEVQNQASKEGIEWRFIAPQAAWWGGFYERMVGSVKRHLRRTLGSAFLNSEELQTVLTEIEAIINSRPLTTMSEDPDDAEYITPSHFLLGRLGNNLSEAFPNDSSAPSKDSLRKRWIFRKRLLNNFWRKWSNEYLLFLQSAHSVKSPNADSAIQINDVVLLKDDRIPRNKWKMARISEVTTGRDGKIRSAMLQTSNGNYIRRAIQRICPLEIV